MFLLLSVLSFLVLDFTSKLIVYLIDPTGLNDFLVLRVFLATISLGVPIVLSSLGVVLAALDLRFKRPVTFGGVISLLLNVVLLTAYILMIVVAFVTV